MFFNKKNKLKEKRDFVVSPAQEWRDSEFKKFQSKYKIGDIYSYLAIDMHIAIAGDCIETHMRESGTTVRFYEYKIVFHYKDSNGGLQSFTWDARDGLPPELFRKYEKHPC